MKTTIYGIAKSCKVSIATVSRALNPATRGKVAAGTLRRIDEAARRAGYTPSLAARQLGASSFRTIGIVLPHFQGIFFSDYYRKILAGAADAMLETDYRFKMILLKSDKGPGWDRYDFRAGEGVDALILTHWPNFFSGPSAISRLGLPCVVMNDPEPGIRAHLAAGDNRAGGALAARHLLAKGHRRIAVLSGPRWSSDSRDRVAGFQAALKKTGLSCVVRDAGFQEQKACEVTLELLRERRGLSAVFCCNDLMACGALRAVAAAGLSCPKDVSVVGYDDDERARTASPALTSVSVPVYEMARQSTRRLVEYLDSDRKGAFLSERTECPVELAERASVRDLAKAGR